MQKSVEVVETKEGERARNAKCLILPLVFWNVCVRKGVAGVNFGSVVYEGVAGGRFRMKTGKTRKWLGSAESKAVGIL